MSESMTEGIRPRRQPDSRMTRNFAPGTWARALPIAGALTSWLVFALLSVWFLLGEHRVDRILLFGLEPPFKEPGGVGHLDDVAWSFTALGSPEVVVFFTAALLGGLLLFNRLKAAAFVVVSVGGGTMLGYLAKSAFGYFRPHHVAGSEAMLNTSFPSGHALLATLFFLSGVILFCNEIRTRRLRVYVHAQAILAAALTGASRVYLGLHWPSDVLAGWAFAVGWIVIAHFLVYDLSGRRFGTCGAVGLGGNCIDA